ncbi:MAG: peptide ABC transporter substrate-binding protein [Acidobacteriota bacterium]|nr:peptide ABC transporter substrate-binding protein [Acidobacteriota bacterium]
MTGVVSIIALSCGELQQPAPETFYSETKAPQKQEFRWSNGKLPKSFDPAMASAPPETDIVRAIFEGLTDTDPKTLNAIPAIAKSWKSADETRIWTFRLRKDARWSNGETVTAHDFVKSWKRLAKLGYKLPHHKLLHNISGVHLEAKPIEETAKKKPDAVVKAESNGQNKPGTVSTAVPEAASRTARDRDAAPVQDAAKPLLFGVEAIGDFELRVTLNEPDEQFPKLVAHPMFRPVYSGGAGFEEGKLTANVVTNGAFRISSVGKDGVTLDREEGYYDRSKVRLERVTFVPSETADSALAAYRAGDVDAVTNTSFEPLALKILTPFVDFKTTTHSALNFYAFNVKRHPFNDRRVREALAISIERERLTEGEMEGSAQPAFDYLPFDVGREKKLASDTERAKSLFEKAGFPDAEGFPKIKLLINRNNVQEKIARSVAKMWKDNLNVDTEIVIKGGSEFEEILASGEYDIVRRGVVLPTADETANMLAIFSTDRKEDSSPKSKRPVSASSQPSGTTKEKATASGAGNSNVKSSSNGESLELLIDTGVENEKILTEEEAIASIPAIPLYFPTSYSLVKPYVLGFEMNTLDAPSLKYVYIDSNWQPGKQKGQS